MPPNHVFLAWQCATTRKIVPVGRLLALGSGGYEFSYIGSVRRAQDLGFGPLVSFPEFETVYRSKSLPALFQNRVMPTSRPDFPSFVSELGLGTSASPIEVLGRSGGRRATDELEVFSPPTELPGETSEMYVLVRGVRHVRGAEEAIVGLEPGQRLLVLRDEQNPHAVHAKLLRTDGTELIGYLPDYLAQELDRRENPSLQALFVTVEKVNPPPAPVHHRLLCRVEFPTADSLFKGADYAPIGIGATPVAA